MKTRRQEISQPSRGRNISLTCYFFSDKSVCSKHLVDRGMTTSAVVVGVCADGGEGAGEEGGS